MRATSFNRRNPRPRRHFQPLSTDWSVFAVLVNRFLLRVDHELPRPFPVSLAANGILDLPGRRPGLAATGLAANCLPVWRDENNVEAMAGRTLRE